MDDSILIAVLDSFNAKKVVIQLVNGGIDVNKEEISLQSGDVINASSSSPSSTDGYTNITLIDGSTIMDVPISKIGYPNNAPKKTGCGGCRKRRK